MDTIKTFEEFVNDDSFHIESFEDYSTTLKKSYSSSYGCIIYEYENCKNNCVILEGSFNRLLNKLHDDDFAILSAYINKFTKKENILRNRKLRKILNDNKMGVHQLVGHWLEAPEGKKYKDCKKSELSDVIERSYVIVRPEEMSYDDFKKLIIELMTIDKITQDCCVIHQNGDSYFLLYPDGTEEKLGDNLTLNKIAQAYSEYVVNKRTRATFVFEGVESPDSNWGYRIFQENMINYCK